MIFIPILTEAFDVIILIPCLWKGGGEKVEIISVLRCQSILHHTEPPYYW